MKAIVKNKTQSRILAIVLTVLLVMYGFTATADAACSNTYSHVFLGTGYYEFAQGVLDADVSGYVYYHANNAAYLYLHSMVQIITNHGEVVLNEASFQAHSGNMATEHHAYGLVNTVEQGETVRVEANWHHVYDGYYMKNGNLEYAVTKMNCGNSMYDSCEWWAYFYKTYYETDFV